MSSPTNSISPTGSTRAPKERGCRYARGNVKNKPTTNPFRREARGLRGELQASLHLTPIARGDGRVRASRHPHPRALHRSAAGRRVRTSMATTDVPGSPGHASASEWVVFRLGGTERGPTRPGSPKRFMQDTRRDVLQTSEEEGNRRPLHSTATRAGRGRQRSSGQHASHAEWPELTARHLEGLPTEVLTLEQRSSGSARSRFRTCRPPPRRSSYASGSSRYEESRHERTESFSRAHGVSGNRTATRRRMS